jgi:hypothetical protein
MGRRADPAPRSTTAPTGPQHCRRARPEKRCSRRPADPQPRRAPARRRDHPAPQRTGERVEAWRRDGIRPPVAVWTLRAEVPSGLTPRTPAVAGTATLLHIAAVSRIPARQQVRLGCPRQRRIRRECRLPAGCTERDGIGIGDSGCAPSARAGGLDHWSSGPGAAPTVRDGPASGRMPRIGRRAARF